jgi:hypothetical protein
VKYNNKSYRLGRIISNYYLSAVMKKRTLSGPYYKPYVAIFLLSVM